MNIKFLKSSGQGSVVGGIITLLIYGAIIFGYGRCVYKLVTCDFSNKTSWKPEVIYGIGTFSGLGCIIGYMDLGE